MNNDNKVLFVFGFIFYFIGELATTHIALSNGLTEKGLIRIITSTNFPTMVVMKLIFFIPLYLFIVYLENTSQYKTLTIGNYKNTKIGLLSSKFGASAIAITVDVLALAGVRGIIDIGFLWWTKKKP